MKRSVLLALVVLLSTMVSCATSDREQALQATVVAQRTQIAQLTKGGTPPVVPSVTATSAQTRVGQPGGQSVSWGNWRIAVIGVDLSAQSFLRAHDPLSWAKKAREGYRLVVVKVVVENTGKTIAAFGFGTEPVTLKIQADKGYSYEAGMGLPGLIPPRFRIQTDVVAEVPTVATGLRLNFEVKKGVKATFDLYQEYRDPGYLFPTEGQTGFMRLNEGSVTVPDKIAVTVTAVETKKGGSYVGQTVVELSVKNLGGYDLRLSQPALSQPASERGIRVAITLFNVDGTYLVPRAFSLENLISPGLSAAYGYVTEPVQRDFQREDASKLLVVISSGNVVEGYGIYDLR